MASKNKVFIATSLDGFIADKNGGIEWLDSIPEINTVDTGYNSFMAEIDALIMGRNTFEKVLSFGIEWPYEKPVFVLSNSLSQIPKELENQVFLINGSLNEVLKAVHSKGFTQLYIDGGAVIRSFLNENLIDEMIITTIPVLLGEGVSLFGDIQNRQMFQCKETKLFLESIVQSRFEKIK